MADVVLIGHSVSAMIGVLAAVTAPELLSTSVVVGPSARDIGDGDYVRGFSSSQIEERQGFLDEEAMASAVIGDPDRPELAAEPTESLRRTPAKVMEAIRGFV